MYIVKDDETHLGSGICKKIYDNLPGKDLIMVVCILGGCSILAVGVGILFSLSGSNHVASE